jgi:hypothetical protein
MILTTRGARFHFLCTCSSLGSAKRSKSNDFYSLRSREQNPSLARWWRRGAAWNRSGVGRHRSEERERKKSSRARRPGADPLTKYFTRREGEKSSSTSLTHSLRLRLRRRTILTWLMRVGCSTAAAANALCTRREHFCNPIDNLNSQRLNLSAMRPQSHATAFGFASFGRKDIEQCFITRISISKRWRQY